MIHPKLKIEYACFRQAINNYHSEYVEFDEAVHGTKENFGEILEAEHERRLQEIVNAHTDIKEAKKTLGVK